MRTMRRAMGTREVMTRQDGVRIQHLGVACLALFAAVGCSSRSRRPASLALVALALIAQGCDARTSSSPRPERAAGKERGGEPPLDEERLERLRSLGYLGTSGLPKRGAGSGVTILHRDRVAPGPTLV
jgi:hypothetical protein